MDASPYDYFIPVRIPVTYSNSYNDIEWILKYFLKTKNYMCISAGASFGASAVLLAVGGITLKVTKTRSALVFSSIPLLFATQQFIEGFMWLTLSDPDYFSLQKYPTYGFLFFALVVWPTVVPLSVYLLEQNQKLKKIQLFFTITGMILSLFMIITLLFYNVKSSILTFHIHYEVAYPWELPFFKGIIYFIPTAIPLFISSVKWMKVFGVAITLSFLVTN
jgi:hypothetical protein